MRRQEKHFGTCSFPFLASAFLLILQCSITHGVEKVPDFSVLEKTVLEELKETNTPGAAISVIQDGNILFEKGFGVSSLETKLPVSSEMLFQIGSLTKMFTAAMLVTLEQQGKVKLDSPISAYIKELKPGFAEITTHQLLSQTSGLKDQPADYGLHGENALSDFLLSLPEKEYCLLPPGKAFSYSNPGYAMAGLLIQEAGSTSYVNQMTDRIFKPLGMKSTTFEPTLAMTFPLALGHNEGSDGKLAVVRPFAEDTRFLPAGYMYSNVRDLSRFVIAFLNNGTLDHQQVLAPAVIRKLSTAYVDVPADPFFEDSHYGYGLFIHKYRGLVVMEHGGSMPGFSGNIWMVPDHHFAIIILTNKEGVPFRKTSDQALQMFLPVQSAAPLVSETVVPMTDQEMASYVGIYRNRWNVELVMREGKLFLKRFGLELQVVKIGDHLFSLRPADGSKADHIMIYPESNDDPGYLQMFIWAFRKEARAQAIQN